MEQKTTTTQPPPTQPFHRPPPGSKTCERETAAVALLCHAHQFIHKSNPMDLLTSIRFIFPQENQSEITSSKWNEEKKNSGRNGFDFFRVGRSGMREDAYYAGTRPMARSYVTTRWPPTGHPPARLLPPPGPASPGRTSLFHQSQSIL